jgi:hypothetical protein
MHISRASSQATQITAAPTEATNQESSSSHPSHSLSAQHNSASGQSSETELLANISTTKPQRPSAQSVLSKYDLTQISPTQIDQMSAELRQSDFDDVGFIIGLEARGDNWRTHMQGALDDAGYEYGSSYDAAAQTDVIASSQNELQLALKYGEPTEFLSDQVEKMKRYHAQGHPQTAQAAPSPQLAQALLYLQAQQFPQA